MEYTSCIRLAFFINACQIMWQRLLVVFHQAHRIFKWFCTSLVRHALNNINAWKFFSSIIVFYLHTCPGNLVLFTFFFISYCGSSSTVVPFVHFFVIWPFLVQTSLFSFCFLFSFSHAHYKSPPFYSTDVMGLFIFTLKVFFFLSHSPSVWVHLKY